MNVLVEGTTSTAVATKAGAATWDDPADGVDAAAAPAATVGTDKATVNRLALPLADYFDKVAQSAGSALPSMPLVLSVEMYDANTVTWDQELISVGCLDAAPWVRAAGCWCPVTAVTSSITQATR